MQKAYGIVFVILVSGCSDSTQEKLKNSFDDGFRKSFKTSFVDSCAQPAGGDKLKDACTCLADDLIANLPVSDLMDTEKTTEYMKNFSLQKCKS